MTYRDDREGARGRDDDGRTAGDHVIDPRGGAGGATIGTVKLVDGKNVYVQDAQGNVVKVTTNPNTQVTVSKSGTVAQLSQGSTIVVRGTASSDGTSTVATSISPSTGFGGAGRFGGGGGGAAAGG